MANPKVLDIALNEVGVKEISGPKANPRVVEYFEASHSDVTSDETAWCSAFMNWVWAQVGIAGTYNLAARSWLRWGVAAEPAPGVVVIFPRGKSDWQGHVAMIVEVKGDILRCVGGNQANQVSIATYRKSSALGFRKPKTIGNSKSLLAAGAAGGGTVMGLVADVAQQALPIAQDAGNYIDTLRWVGYGLALIGVIAFAYRRVKKMKAGT